MRNANDAMAPGLRRAALGLLLLVASLASPLWAQDAWEQFADRLTGDEREKVQEAIAQAQREIRIAQAELDVIKAQVSRLLLDSDVDLRKVEKLLRDALEWELAIRLAEIRREVEIRKIVGDRRWAQYVELRTAQATRLQSAIAQRAEQQIDRITRQILEWMASRQKQEEVEARIKALLKQMLERAEQGVDGTVR